MIANNNVSGGHYQDFFDNLTENLDLFVDTVKSRKSTLMANNQWTVKDMLCHIVFWHEAYATNYEAMARGLQPPLPEQMSTINTRGVDSLKRVSIKELVSRLRSAHQSLHTSIIIEGVPQMTYSKGGRTYETGAFLDMIARHIARHTIQVRRAK
ncbi:ClbS/DfsB family four-helix bundle protein [Candidatus Saccharibacteria bacterium]|nr:ClbS/DfsB family four-helix bundle protein [Candidatus Saccharibacteria bacterium]